MFEMFDKAPRERERVNPVLLPPSQMPRSVNLAVEPVPVILP